MSYEISYTRRALKNLEVCKETGLGEKVADLLDVIREDPLGYPPEFERLKGVKNVYSRRINIQHRLVYEVDFEGKRIKVVSLWTHYE